MIRGVPYVLSQRRIGNNGTARGICTRATMPSIDASFQSQAIRRDERDRSAMPSPLV